MAVPLTPTLSSTRWAIYFCLLFLPVKSLQGGPTERTSGAGTGTDMFDNVSNAATPPTSSLMSRKAKDGEAWRTAQLRRQGTISQTNSGFVESSPPCRVATSCLLITENVDHKRASSFSQTGRLPQAHTHTHALACKQRCEQACEQVHRMRTRTHTHMQARSLTHTRTHTHAHTHTHASKNTYTHS